MTPTRRITVSIIAALALIPAPAPAQSTRAIMDDVFDAIAYLLPLSLRESEGEVQRDEELLRRKLDVLSRSAATLEKHTGKHEAELALLARSFDRSIEDIRQAFDSRYPAFSYYAVMNLTEHCAACHARLPDERDNAFGQRLMARMDVDALAPADLAQIYVATRQFDAAAGTWERVLLDPDVTALDSDLAGTLIDYLAVCIGVLQDVERPRALLARFVARPDVPLYLHDRVDVWQRALTGLAPALTGPATLAGARTVFDAGTALTLAPAGRERAVHDLVAASLLRRFLAATPGAAAEARAEAYFLLGIIAMRTTELKPSVPEMELLFEAAIRAAPKGPHAHRAYALLEEYGFVGDVHLGRPNTETPLLDMAALRALIVD
ncbi:MAG: hypothetical protein IT495_08705 [Gammaproteobacteria bacterium]|nr:hypothetical protein [Gammaproteobacteria bacterium]